MKNIFLFLFLLAYLFVPAQSAKVLYERKLKLGLEDKILTEHHLSYDLNNSDYLLLSGTYLNPKDSSDYKDFSIISKGNGKTWSNLKMFGVSPAGDPWAEITPNGTAIYTVLSDSLFLYRSKDAGLNWEEDSLNLGEGHDHETVIIDEKQNIIYIASIKNNNIYLNKSTDDGKNFLSPKLFRFSNLGANTMTPVILSDSTLLIPFSTYLRESILKDGKQGYEFLKNNLDWIVSYNNKPDTWGTPYFLCESCGKGFPVLAVDKFSAAFKDRLYYVCSNQTTNEILFHYSITEGKSWTAPIVLKKYINHSTAVHNPFTGIPQVVVNNKGVVGVVWQDRTDDPKGKCQLLYFTASLDGGVNFIKPIRVSKVLSCQENSKNSWAADRWKSGGDYIGFISKPNGNFQATWADSREGISQLYMAEIKVE